MKRTLITIAAIAVLLTGCADNKAPTNDEGRADDADSAGEPQLVPAAPNVGAGSGGVGSGGAGSAVARANARRAWARLSESEQAKVCDRYESRGYTNTRRDLVAGKLAISGSNMTVVQVDSTMAVIDEKCS